MTEQLAGHRNCGYFPEPAFYNDETEDERLARRKSRWTPTTFVEVQPSS